MADRDPTEDAIPDHRPGRIQPAEVAARYLLLDRIGEGGSADVYTAYDRTLDRKIALKLLRDAGGEGRLLREAQALARLKHPNVVQVYDCGALGDRVFLAMELVGGGSLRSWLEVERPWKAVLAAFVAAGRGLAAIHAAGLVHRDFKPENVLVDTDGAVRVADLGLVRLNDDAPPAPPTSSLAGDLTLTRGVVGTPRYMAPEQLAGAAVTEAGDQFSFAAALYFGLFRQSAFAGESLEEIGAEVAAGRVRPPPSGHGVPGWLVRAVLRGLETDPQERWPSMEALLAELTRDRGRVARRLAVAAVILGLAAAFWLARAGAPAACGGSASRLAGIWDAARRGEVQRAFAASNRSYAEQAFVAAANLLDGYTAGWVAMREDACQATVRREQSSALLDLRMACLDRRLGRLRALVDVLATPGESVVDRAVIAVGQLEPLDRCADAEGLLAAVPRVASPTLTPLIDRGTGLTAAGKFEEALQLLTPVVDEARRLAHPPLLADALLALLEAQQGGGRARGSEALAREALTAATASRDPRLEGAAWIALVRVSLARSEQNRALDFTLGGELAIQRAGDPADLRARLASYRTRAYFRQGRTREALATVEEALALADQTRLPADVLGDFLDLKAHILLEEDRVAEAIVEFERSAAILATLGEDHPYRADPLMGLGAARARVGDTAGARVALAHSLTILESTLGPDHLEVAIALTWLADVANRDGSWAEAEAVARRALAIKEKVLGPDGYSVPETLEALGSALDHLGRTEEAGEVLARALALCQKLDQMRSGDALVTLLLLAAHHRHAGRPAEAAAAADRAVEVIAARGAPDRLDRLVTLIEIRLDQQRTAEALIERAEAVAYPGLDQQRLAFARARVQNDRAKAREILGTTGPGWLRDEITAWLAAR